MKSDFLWERVSQLHGSAPCLEQGSELAEVGLALLAVALVPSPTLQAPCQYHSVLGSFTNGVSGSQSVRAARPQRAQILLPFFPQAARGCPGCRGDAAGTGMSLVQPSPCCMGWACGSAALGHQRLAPRCTNWFGSIFTVPFHPGEHCLGLILLLPSKVCFW